LFSRPVEEEPRSELKQREEWERKKRTFCPSPEEKKKEENASKSEREPSACREGRFSLGRERDRQERTVRNLLRRRPDEETVDEAGEDEVDAGDDDGETLELNHREGLHRERGGWATKRRREGGKKEKRERKRTIMVVVMRRTPETAKP
jgi:hypothetical protein